MRWLCLVHLQARRRVWVHAPADSALPRWLEGGFRRWTRHRPGAGFGGGPGVSRPRTPRAPRIFPGQDLAGLEAWLRMASLRAAGPSTSRAPNISRPGSGRTGGLVPNSKLAGGGNNRPQLPSKIQSLPKGSGSVLPSIAQGKQPGPGPQGKGFPDLSGKGPGEQETERRSHLLTSSFGKIGVGRIRANWRIFRRTVPKIGITSVSSEITRM